MRRLPRAITLARLAVGGFALVAATWLLTFVPIPRVPAHGCGFWAEVWSTRLRLLAFVVPGVLGLSFGFWAERRFRRAFVDELWGEGELAPVRAFLRSDGWKWVALCFLPVMALGLLEQLKGRWHGGFYWYLLLLPSQSAQRLKQMVSPPVVKSTGLADWRNFGPLRSEHWGERNA